MGDEGNSTATQRRAGRVCRTKNIKVAIWHRSRYIIGAIQGDRRHSILDTGNRTHCAVEQPKRRHGAFKDGRTPLVFKFWSNSGEREDCSSEERKDLSNRRTSLFLFYSCTGQCCIFLGRVPYLHASWSSRDKL